MDSKVHFKGIKAKIKDDEDIFVTEFEVVTDDWDKAIKAKETIENKLQNILNGQETLK